MAYGTLRVRRTSPRRYAQRMAVSVSNSTASPLVKKTVICLVLFGVALALTHIPLAQMRGVASSIRWVFTSDMDFAPVMNLVQTAAGKLSGGRWNLWALPVMGQDAQALIWPVEGKIVSLYGWTTDPATKQERLFEGVDISVPAGTPVRAALSGVILDVRDSAVYGKVVEIEHGLGMKTIYGGCSEVSVTLRERVQQGDTFARVGPAQGSGGPRLHLELVVDGNRVDPLKYLPAL